MIKLLLLSALLLAGCSIEQPKQEDEQVPMAKVVYKETYQEVRERCPSCPSCSKSRDGLWVNTDNPFCRKFYYSCLDEETYIVDLQKREKMPLKDAKKLLKEQPELIDHFYEL